MLENNESQRRAHGQKAIREDPRLLEKELKTLATFYLERHAFIKAHMIYKQFGDEHLGAKFHQLAFFYHAIATCPACLPILKFAAKVQNPVPVICESCLPLRPNY